jgi:hypothetical protein
LFSRFSHFPEANNGHARARRDRSRQCRAAFRRDIDAYNRTPGDKTFRIYLAENRAVIQEHARLSGFPANRVTEIGKVIDPTTANGAKG